MTNVTLYKDPNEQGQPLVIDSSKMEFIHGVADLRDYIISGEYNGTWDNQISSIRVLSGAATFFLDPNYGGGARQLIAGQSVNYLGGSLLTSPPFSPLDTDNISSVRIDAPSTAVVLYQDPDFHGPKLTLFASDPDLSKDLMPVTWNDQTSSIIVQGTATFYKDVNFNGGPINQVATPINLPGVGLWKQQLGSGRYNSIGNLLDWGKPNGPPNMYNDQLSSISFP